MWQVPDVRTNAHQMRLKKCPGNLYKMEPKNGTAVKMRCLVCNVKTKYVCLGCHQYYCIVNYDDKLKDLISKKSPRVDFLCGVRPPKTWYHHDANGKFCFSVANSCFHMRHKACIDKTFSNLKSSWLTINTWQNRFDVSSFCCWYGLALFEVTTLLMMSSPMSLCCVRLDESVPDMESLYQALQTSPIGLWSIFKCWKVDIVLRRRYLHGRRGDEVMMGKFEGRSCWKGIQKNTRL